MTTPGESMSNSSAIRIVRPSEFDKGTLQTPGSERLAAVAPQLGVESTMWGGMFEVKPGGSHRYSPSWRAADHRICAVRRMRSALGRERGVCSWRGGRRFHSRAGIPAAHGDQSVRFAAVPMGRGEKHLDSDRGQSSRGHMAIVLRRRERGRRFTRLTTRPVYPFNDEKGRRVATRNESVGHG